MRVAARHFVDRQAVMNVMPMVRRGVGRIDTERLDSINRLQDLLDFRPAREAQQDFCAGVDIRDSRIAFPRWHGPQDVDARSNGAIVIGGPADEGEDTAWGE